MEQQKAKRQGSPSPAEESGDDCTPLLDGETRAPPFNPWSPPRDRPPHEADLSTRKGSDGARNAEARRRASVWQLAGGETHAAALEGKATVQNTLKFNSASSMRAYAEHLNKVNQVAANNHKRSERLYKNIKKDGKKAWNNHNQEDAPPTPKPAVWWDKPPCLAHASPTQTPPRRSLRYRSPARREDLAARPAFRPTGLRSGAEGTPSPKKKPVWIPSPSPPPRVRHKLLQHVAIMTFKAGSIHEAPNLQRLFHTEEEHA
ncbi:hypothetical protein CYMTET_35569 [Cymbomonas tetramitiformis]|uniref:Uncharacterized protein n=1 Tax=Cymbomonas tetramitiformis TaxID=36881 RepID=A0AAE0F8Y3_9CHLO|nr:hypothetical protein CYMTET_35569 [Cymbomonas tetramitiformis]